MDVSKLPPGVVPAPAGAAEAVTVGQETGPNKVTFESPTMLGIQVQVQHPSNHSGGAEPTPELGLLAGTVVQTRVGPLICVQTRHHDGTSLTAMMTVEEARDWHETWNEVCQKAVLLTAQEGQG